jgi:hypothetical protein
VKHVNELTPGTLVGARRWPYSHAHPDCWQEPYTGILLALDDPRGWSFTLFSPGGEPPPEELEHHVRSCLAEGPLADVVPVLWDFREHGRRVHWEPLSMVMPAEVDRASWQRARERQWRQLARQRRARA